MDKQNHPKAFGVFKPVDHVLMAFSTLADLQTAETALNQQGFSAEAITFYGPKEMLRQTDEDLKNAGVLANIGQELNLVKAHRALAEVGCNFLVVHTPDNDQVMRASEVAQQAHAKTAQHYGRFIIEELISSPQSGRQVFESPERGLDETPSSRRQ